MLTILDTPPIVVLSGNPVNVVASTDMTGSKTVLPDGEVIGGETNICIHLSILRLVNGTWERSGLEDSMSIVNQEVSFNLQQYFEDLLKPSFTFPEHYTNMVIPQPGMVIKYRINLWESYVQYDGTIVDLKLTDSTTFDADFYVVPGALSEDDQALVNTLSTTWWDEWTTRKSFQHWLPGTKKTSIAAVEKLFWIARRTATETVAIAWVASDATTGTVNVDFAMTIYSMYELCISPVIAEQLAGKALKSYAVTITGQSETVGFSIDRTYFENQEYFLLQNSFGCFENLWCRGAREGEMEFNRTQYERILGSNYQMTDRKLGATRATTTRNRKSNTGFFDSENWFNWALALLSGEDAWIYTETSLAPIALTGEKVAYLDDMQEEPWALEIEWKHSREGMFGGGLGLALKNITPPFFSKLAALFFKTERGALVDKIAGLTAPQVGANITWPNIAASDVLDFSDATFWDQALIGATAWYNAGTPRTCPLTFMAGSEWAEAATDATHARLFHRDTTGALRSVIPVLVYNQNLTSAEQATVVAWLEWYFTIWQDGSILTENNNILTQ